MNTQVKRVFISLLDLLYPPRCGGCDRAGEGWWCATCDSRTPWLALEDSVCELALDPDSGISDTSLVVLSSARFAPPLREAIHRFKYEGQPQLAESFAEHLAQTWRAHHMPADAFAPVPLHRSRLRERGFNQSDLLAQHVARLLGAPISRTALTRVRHTAQQVHLSVEDRRQNVRDAFAASFEAVNGKHIVLVDDVLTTGATLVECAQALYRAGAQRVRALTLARAHAQDDNPSRYTAAPPDSR